MLYFHEFYLKWVSVTGEDCRLEKRQASSSGLCVNGKELVGLP